MNRQTNKQIRTNQTKRFLRFEEFFKAKVIQLKSRLNLTLTVFQVCVTFITLKTEVTQRLPDEMHKVPFYSLSTINNNYKWLKTRVLKKINKRLPSNPLLV